MLCCCFRFGHVLRYKVWPKTKKAIAQIVELVKRYPDESGSQRVNVCELAAFSQASRHCAMAGIVYCGTRRDTETVADKIRAALAEARLAIKVTYYHAGIEDPMERRINHEMWSNDECKVRALGGCRVTQQPKKRAKLRLLTHQHAHHARSSLWLR